MKDVTSLRPVRGDWALNEELTAAARSFPEVVAVGSSDVRVYVSTLSNVCVTSCVDLGESRRTGAVCAHYHLVVWHAGEDRRPGDEDVARVLGDFAVLPDSEHYYDEPGTARHLWSPVRAFDAGYAPS